MRYHVTTTHGTSEAYYQPTAQLRQYGSGQGFRNSPSLWTFVSTLLIKALPAKTDGLQFNSPRHDLSSHRYIDAYVDDTTLWTNQASQHDGLIPHPAFRLQQAAQWWEELLHTSGGALELSKCLYYIFRWKYLPDGSAVLKTPQEIGHQIHLLDHATNTSQEIEHRPCTKAHRTLGVLLCPDDNDNEEYQRLLQKSDRFARSIMTSNFTPEETWTAYRSIYLPSLGYSLGITALTPNQLDQIESRSTCALLTKMGYNPNTPRALVFGPAETGGIGLTSLSTLQGKHQLTLFIEHVRQLSPVGRLLIITTQWFQIFSGLPDPILLQPDTPLLYVPGAWLHSFRQFLSSASTKLHLPNHTIRLLPRRVGDINLMFHALQQKLTLAQLKSINHCRLFLKVEYLSDMCNAQGTELCLHDGQNPHVVYLRPETTGLIKHVHPLPLGCDGSSTLENIFA
jgi:hypothetical protein